MARDADPGDIFDKLQFGFMIFLEMSNQDWDSASV